MKVKRTRLGDQCGSAYSMRATVRELVWGIVERIHQENNAANVSHHDEISISLNQMESMHIPTQFASKGSKSAKKKRKKDSFIDGNNGITLPKPRYNGTFVEHNIYLCRDPHFAHTSGAKVYVRILGIAASIVPELRATSADATPATSSCFVVGRLLNDHCIDTDMSCSDKDATTTHIFDRNTQLRPISSLDIAIACNLVNKDEQRMLQLGAPDDVHGKYWDQRYRLLSRYDRGIRLDSESWYSITPEVVAQHVTVACIGRAREKAGICITNVLDCFSGCGGNTIPFAVHDNCRVTAVDLDPVKLSYLRHNAMLYGAAEDRITTIAADVYQLLESIIGDDKLNDVKNLYNTTFSEYNNLEEDEGEEEEEEEGEEAECAGGLDDVQEKSCKNDIVVAGSSSSTSTTLTNTAAFDDAIIATATPATATITSSITAYDTTAGTCTGASGNGASSSTAKGGAGTADTADTADKLNGTVPTPQLVILSPPWGGPEYQNVPSYDLYSMLSCGCGLYLAMLAHAVCPNVLYLIPINTDDTQIRYIANEVLGEPCVIENISINAIPKVKAVYIGPMASASKSPSKKRKTNHKPAPAVASTTGIMMNASSNIVDNASCTGNNNTTVNMPSATAAGDEVVGKLTAASPAAVGSHIHFG
mmetsp:Transcript_24898/g.41494  ORF Transcript_24898/g.41494 Transcript_24898/m.41494 type:complete len:648 (-) Transcript_24898:113-2056(-)